MKIKRIGDERAIIFAAEELKSYLERIDSSLKIEIVTDEAQENCLNIGICDSFEKFLPYVLDKTVDDAIYIDVKEKKGVITGTNPRSVLIACYRYLKELGVCFIRPGKDNEVLPKADSLKGEVKVSQKADHRHRQVCIEGACSYEHVWDMIDWIPKVGMNGYYMQFVRPYGFFKVWYEHEGNRYLKKEYKTDEEYAEIVEKLEDEIQKRDIIYAAGGHSWQCECVGLDGTYWQKETKPLDPQIIPYLAEINGKRELFGEVAMNTNLCYSNPEVRERMTDCVVDFIKKKPFTKQLHFWMADGGGNECQCKECRKLDISDWYINMANMLDEKLTKEGMDTKVVIGATRSLPRKEKLRDTGRFIIDMYPIQRDFSEVYPSKVDDEYLSDAKDLFINNPDGEKKYSPEEEAQIVKSTKNYVAFMQRWYKELGFKNIDAMLYDYLLIWFHYHDPSYMLCSRIIAEDTKNYNAMGISGISSCQGQRVFFPTALPMKTMAQFLWDKNTDYDEFKNKILTEEYGEDGIMLGELLESFAIEELTKLMTGTRALGWEETKGEEMVNLIKSRYPVIDKMQKLLEENQKKDYLPDAVKQSWEYFKFYPQFAKYWLDIWTASFGMNDVSKTREIAVRMNDYIMKNEQYIHRVFDGCLFRRRIYFFFNNTKMPGTVLDLEDYEEE